MKKEKRRRGRSQSLAARGCAQQRAGKRILTQEPQAAGGPRVSGHAHRATVTLAVVAAGGHSPKRSGVAMQTTGALQARNGGSEKSRKTQWVCCGPAAGPPASLPSACVWTVSVWPRKPCSTSPAPPVPHSSTRARITAEIRRSTEAKVARRRLRSGRLLS